MRLQATLLLSGHLSQSMTGTICVDNKENRCQHPEPPTTQTPLPTGTWKIDPIHSSVEFQVKHLGIATVKGQFTDFEGTLEVGPDGVKAYGSVKVASVDTREDQRDEHLRSADFFEARTTPRSRSDRPPCRPPTTMSSRSRATSRSTA